MNTFEIICALIFTAFCIILAYIYSIVNRAYFYWDKKKVNGPIPRYIIGTWVGFAEKFLGSEDYANALKYPKAYGTYDGITPNLLITDPDLIKEVVATSCKKFQDVRFASESSVVLKESLLCLSGGEKTETQSLVNSLINSQKLGKLIPAIDTCADVLIKKISEERQEDGKVNMTSAVAEFINETMSLVVLGVDLNADQELKDDFLKNSKQILRVKNPQSIWSLFPFLYENYFKESWIFPTDALQYFVGLVLKGISDPPTENSPSEEKPLSFINLLAEAAEEEKKLVKEEEEGSESSNRVLTNNAIISKCVASLLTLTSATRTTVLLGIYALANNEDVQERLYQEIQKKKSEKVTYEEIQNLDYLDKVVKEVLRLYPFEFRLERVCVEETKLGDIEIDKNVRVSVPLYALHRLEQEYPEPEKFNPERFSEAASQNRNPFTYLPFGQAGFNGSDLSLQLGIFTTKVTLFKLVDKYKFSGSVQTTLGSLFKKGFTRVLMPEDIEIVAEARI